MVVKNLETNYGNVRLKIGTGNIVELEEPADILVVSVRKEGYEPLPNTVVGALNEKGISINDLQKQPIIDLRNDLGIWISEEIVGCYFKYILCIEMEKDKTGEADFLNLIGNLFSALSILRIKENILIRNLVLPVLGTGHQNIDPEIVVPYVLKAFDRYLDRYKDISEICIFDIDGKKIDRVVYATDKYLKITSDELSENQKNLHVQEMRKSIIRLIDNHSGTKAINKELMNIRETLKSNRFRISDLTILFMKYLRPLILKNQSSTGLSNSHIKDYFEKKNLENIYSTMVIFIRDNRNYIEHTESKSQKLVYEYDIYDMGLIMVCFYKLLKIELSL